MNAKFLGILYLFLGMALFGSATPVSKLVGAGFPVFTASTLRVLLGALALFPFVAFHFKANYRHLNWRAWWEIGLISLFGMVGFTVFLILGMKYISGVAAALL